MQNFEPGWQQALKPEFSKSYWENLQDFLTQEYASQVIYPHESQVFSAFALTPLSKVKVVILGQDPYHGEGQAHGLAFSVPPSVKPPPSLQNIFKELVCDIGCNMPTQGLLEHWANQGVLLLNTVLTVRQSQASSHRSVGWEQFTDAAIDAVNAHCEHVVFILWGKGAQQKASRLDTSKHLILQAPHPSPLSSYRGFFGSKPFSKTNAFLAAHKINAIDWCLPDN